MIVPCGWWWRAAKGKNQTFWLLTRRMPAPSRERSWSCRPTRAGGKWSGVRFQKSALGIGSVQVESWLHREKLWRIAALVHAFLLFLTRRLGTRRASPGPALVPSHRAAGPPRASARCIASVTPWPISGTNILHRSLGRSESSGCIMRNLPESGQSLAQVIGRPPTRRDRGHVIGQGRKPGLHRVDRQVGRGSRDPPVAAARRQSSGCREERRWLDPNRARVALGLARVRAHALDRGGPALGRVAKWKPSVGQPADPPQHPVVPTAEPQGIGRLNR